MKKTALFVFGIALIAVAYNNCSGGFGSASSTVNATALSSVGVSQLVINLQITDSNGKVVYDDSVPNSSLTLAAGQEYNFIVSSVSAPPADTVLKLTASDISLPTSTAQTLILNFGSNRIPSGTLIQGNYSLQFVANATGMATVTKSYTAAVSCATPTFTKDSLDPSKITVSAAASNNLFNYSVAGVIANANGSGTYDCALDPSGTSILDTGFQSCSNVFKAYSSAVSTRPVNVVVRDKTCNIAYSVSKSVVLPYVEPTTGEQNVFIYGQTSNATGSTVGDARVDGLTYLATNQADNTLVQSAYSGANFTIQSSQNYGQSSSVNFGVKIALTGITGSLDTAAQTDTLSVANAGISSVAYSTDESGDSQVALSFSGSSCVLSKQNIQVKMVAGTPCASNQTGDQNTSTVEVWGHYKCTGLANSSGAISIEGDFDGLSQNKDSCVGGSGGTGGGIVPISL